MTVQAPKRPGPRSERPAAPDVPPVLMVGPRTAPVRWLSLLIAGLTGAAVTVTLTGMLRDGTASDHVPYVRAGPPAETPPHRPASMPDTPAMVTTVATAADTASATAPARRTPTPEPASSPRPTPSEPEPTPPRRLAVPATPTVTAPPLPGVLAISSRPWGRVFVNGRDAGTTPLPRMSLAAGTYDIRVERPGFHPFHRRVHVPAGDTVRLADIILDPEGT